MSLPSFISQKEVLGRGAALGCSLHAGVLLTQFPGLSPRTSGWDRCSDRLRPRPTMTPPVSRLNSKLSLEQGGRTLARGCPPPEGAHFTHSALSAPPAPVAALRKADGSDCGHGSWARGSGSTESPRGPQRGPSPEERKRSKENAPLHPGADGGFRVERGSLDCEHKRGLFRSEFWRSRCSAPSLPLKGQRSPFLLTLLSWWRVLLGLKGAALEEASGFRHCSEHPRAGGVSAVLGLAPEHPALHVAGPPPGGVARGWPRGLPILSPSSGSGQLWVHLGGRAKPGAAHLGISPPRRAASPGGSRLSGSGPRELYRAKKEPRGRPRRAPRPGALPAPAARAGPCPRVRAAPTGLLLPGRRPTRPRFLL